MYLSIISGFLCVSMVFAGGEVKKITMRFNIDDDGQMMAEDVGLDYRGNIIKINTQALEDKTSAEIYYDTTEGMTEYRQAGHCFLLSNGFGETFSTNMDDWYENVEGVKVMRTGDIVFHNYTAAPFCIDKEKIPLVMQEDCDEIYPAVLVNTVRGQAVYDILEDINGPFETKLYGPLAHDQNANRGGSRGNRYSRGIGKAFGAAAIGLAMALPHIVTAIDEVAGK